MNVYFARSIRGNHKSDDAAVFGAIVETIKACGHTPALELPVLTSNAATDAYIFERDINWLDNSQAMIAEVSNPSLGVGFEIAYAVFVSKIEVLCVARKGSRVSAMITGSGLTLAYYRDQSDLEGIVKEFLAIHVKG